MKPNKQTGKTAYAYLRSARMQKDIFPESLYNQKVSIEKYCRKHKIVLLENFVDCPASGKAINRPNLTILLGKTMLYQVDYVLVHTLDRICRDVIWVDSVRSELKKVGATLVATSPQNNRLFNPLTNCFVKE